METEGSPIHVSTTEELLDRKVAAHTAIGIRHADNVAPSIRKSCQSLRRQAAVRPWSFFFVHTYSFCVLGVHLIPEINQFHVYRLVLKL
jgi:hypothetical protein